MSHSDLKQFNSNQQSLQILFLLANVSYFVVLDKVTPTRLTPTSILTTRTSQEHCRSQQHHRNGLWTSAIWSYRRSTVCVHGSLFVFWCLERYVLLEVILCLLIYSLPGSFFTSSRLVYAASRERYLPAIFGKLHPSRKTPLNATLLQSAITIAFIMLGSGFRSLINFSVVASWAFYFLTVSQNYLYLAYNFDAFPGTRTCDSANQRALIGKVK